ncbi:MAG: type III pantothenate kinase, partial [Acidobacteria bacterium]|nr:type III pantothenate kinase [Acidobacteriota bacterium]
MNKFLLALDVGNTNTVVGLFQGEKVKTDWRLTTHAERTADEVGMWLLQLLEWDGVRPADLEGVAVSSVVPPLDPRLREGVARYLGHQPFFVEPGIRSDMPLLVDTPQDLGADRL